MSKSEQALQWGMQYLTSKKLSIGDYKKVAHTPYSVVYAIKTEEGNVFYLKKTPAALFLEPKVLDFLKKQKCKNIPEVLAKNSDLCCFLMTSCGDISLHQLFKEEIYLIKLNQGISNYTAIQRVVENKAQQLLSLGIPDWRLNKFAELYYQLIQQDKLLLEEGLSRSEIDRLNQLYPRCVELCKDLAKYQIPETIGHCDFHENNILLDNKTGAVNIIDWGEIVITHPFFSLTGCLWHVTYFNKLKRTDLAYRKLQSQCIAPWLNLCNEENLLNALNISDQLNGIYAALGYARMYIATQDQSSTVQQKHHGAIAGCLRSFLQHNLQ